ncbi:hypothetical protein CEXT_749231 [Caerostris extrusa]|uniref:Uncharacterized protein n=1 Tax=Caerostris extrusa TaxID=172846 RepID=A0AAV4V4P1_CAEEX|nr:hypothetical protein CEXT_749231 [Caerostris extrusa]
MRFPYSNPPRNSLPAQGFEAPNFTQCLFLPSSSFLAFQPPLSPPKCVCYIRSAQLSLKSFNRLDKNKFKIFLLGTIENPENSHQAVDFELFVTILMKVDSFVKTGFIAHASSGIPIRIFFYTPLTLGSGDNLPYK